MANESIFAYGSVQTMESAGAQIADAGFSAAPDVALSASEHGDFPLADIALACAFGSAVAAGKTVNLYRRAMSVDGTAGHNEPTPSANYKGTYVGSFQIPTGATSLDYYPLDSVPLTRKCEFYIENTTGQTLSANWVLTAIPKTYKPGS